jgi:hypothetical protein
MRQIPPLAAFAAALTVFSATSIAMPDGSDPQIAACRADARAIADRFAADDIAKAEDLEGRPPGAITVIAYGEKYFVPRDRVREFSATSEMYGERAMARMRVYNEEMGRCLDYTGYYGERRSYGSYGAE